MQSAVCDVTDSRQVEEAVDFLEQVDILVNNAGTNVPEPFLEVSEDNLDRMLAVNVKGVFLVAQAAARCMVERGEGGSIINISSQMGHVGGTEAHGLLRHQACRGGPDEGYGCRACPAQGTGQLRGPDVR